MQIDMFGATDVSAINVVSSPVLSSAGVWLSPDTLAFNAALRSGSLVDAVAVLNRLKDGDAVRVLLSSGFSIRSVKRPALMAEVQASLVAAVRLKMTGMELRVSRELSAAGLATLSSGVPIDADENHFANLRADDRVWESAGMDGVELHRTSGPVFEWKYANYWMGGKAQDFAGTALLPEYSQFYDATIAKALPSHVLTFIQGAVRERLVQYEAQFGIIASKDDPLAPAPLSALAVDSALPVRTPITTAIAGNFSAQAEIRVVDGAGKEYQVFSVRHDYLEVFPIGANGKAEVFAGNSVFFHLNPATASAHATRRHDPIYVLNEISLANTSEVVHSSSIDNAITSLGNKENENGSEFKRGSTPESAVAAGAVRAGVVGKYSDVGGGGEADRESLGVGLAGAGAGAVVDGGLSGLPVGANGFGNGYSVGDDELEASGPARDHGGERDRSGAAVAGGSGVSVAAASLSERNLTASLAQGISASPGLLDGAAWPVYADAAPVVGDSVVRVPAVIGKAIEIEMAGQKSRLLRLQSLAKASGVTLDKRLALQSRAQMAESGLRDMRRAVFDVEDAAIAAVAAGDASVFDKHSILFPGVKKAVLLHVAALAAQNASAMFLPSVVDPHIGRTWNTIHGLATITSLPYPKRTESSMAAMYEYTTTSGAVFRVYEDKIDETIARNERDASPEGVAASAAFVIASSERAAAAAVSSENFEREKAETSAKLDGFIGDSGFLPMRAGQARKSLLSPVRYENKTMPSFEFVSALVAKGLPLTTAQEDRIMPMSSRAYMRADNREQAAHEKKIIEAGQKSVHYVGGFEVGAFEFEYAGYLVRQLSVGQVVSAAPVLLDVVDAGVASAAQLAEAAALSVAGPRSLFPFGQVDQEDRFHKSRVRVFPELRDDVVWDGTVHSVLKAGRLISVKRDDVLDDDGKVFNVFSPLRIAGDRIEVLSICEFGVDVALGGQGSAAAPGLLDGLATATGLSASSQFIASKLNENTHAERLMVQIGMFDPELKAEFEAIAQREQQRHQAGRDRLAVIRAKIDGDTSAWDKTEFAPRIRVMLGSLADAGEKGLEMRAVIQAGINMDARLNTLTEAVVAFREKVAQRELATISVNGIRLSVKEKPMTLAGMIELEPDFAKLPLPIVEAAVLRLNELGKELAVLGFTHYYEVDPRAPKDARDIADQMRDVTSAVLLLAPIRHRIAKGYKTAKQAKLDRLEDFATETIGINTRDFPGVVDSNDLAVEPSAPSESARAMADVVPAGEFSVVDGTNGVAVKQFSLSIPDAAVDYVLSDDDRIGLGGLGEKFADNLRAIQIIRILEAEGRRAVGSELSELARYVGWGGLKGLFDPKNKQWGRQHVALRSLLTDTEWAAASRSQLDAFYTAPLVGKAMYSAVTRLGFESGRVLEPSVGVGNFFGLMPAVMRQNSSLHGVELDILTSRIVAALYPSAKIAQATGFQNYNVPSGYFDMAIGNPPFGSQSVADDRGSAYSGWSIHNYFFAKSIEMLRPGGIMPMVVSHNFLDKLDPHVRQWIARRAELVSGVRLPNSAFKENANTEVVTDVLVFRRLDFENSLGKQDLPDWLDTVDVSIENPKSGESEVFSVNKYFVNNPQNVLGDNSATGSMYRANEYTVLSNGDLEAQLAGWVASLPEGIYVPMDRSAELAQASLSSVAVPVVPEFVKEGSFFLSGSSIWLRLDDRAGEHVAKLWSAPNARAAERMAGMIGLRDALRLQIRLERSVEVSSGIEAGRADLNRLYDVFVKNYGFVNDPVNSRLFNLDTESALVQSLEFNYEKALSAAKALEFGVEQRGSRADKADIFQRRVLFPPGEIEVVESAKDALLHSLNFTGGVDMGYMQRAYGKDSKAIIAELGDLLFFDPADGLVTADQYLSGDVKTKLAQVRKAGALDLTLARNTEALEKIIPTDKLPSEIHAAIGAAWIPRKVFADFANEISGAAASFDYVAATGQWLAGGSRTVSFTKNNSEFGIEKFGALDILTLTMNSRAPEVHKKVIVDGQEKSVIDEEKTEAVRHCADKIRAHWDSWLWSDAGRTDQLVSIYNDKFNRTVERKYDGSHLTLPGMSPSLSLLSHQKNGVWRGLQDRVMLMDQVVGAGKTYEGVAMMMEMRRLGITKKPLIAVPNHLTLQWRSEFYKLYPGANVLAATPQDFEKDNRERFFSKIVTGNWDAVIVGHSSLKKIQVPIEAEMQIINEQFDDISDAIQVLKNARGDKNVIRDMEKIKDNLKSKITRLKEKSGKKDNVVDFGDLGVDALFIDEIHEFKNLFFTTQMNRVAGLGNPAGSGKAFDLFVKVRWLQNTFGNKAPLITATGTPISNSLAEMFTMQRFMQYDKLKANNLHVFDAWAKQYGDVQNVYEVAPSGTGYRLSQRFAKFKNLGSLMGDYRGFADVITLDDLKAQEAALGKTFPVPKLVGGRPLNIVAKRSELQEKFFGIPEIVKDEAENIVFEVNANWPTSIVKKDNGKFVVQQKTIEYDDQAVTRILPKEYETAEEAAYLTALAAITPQMSIDPNSIVGQFNNIAALTRASKGKINALSLTGLANKAGLDYRLIDPRAVDFPESKVNIAVGNILEVAQKWEADKGTQLVFCDLSVPLSAKAKMASKEKRVYVRDDEGALTHKSGTLHSRKGFEGLPYFLVQVGKGVSKSFTMHDPVTGVVLKAGLDSKSDAHVFADRVLARDNGQDQWLALREKMLAITPEEIDEYKNEHSIDADGDAVDSEISMEDIEGSTGVSGFSIYDDMKAKLVAGGMPAHQIEFIHDHDSPMAKDALFKRVNSGDVRVLFGSTPKMGAGTNVQARLVALHHIDAPWRPSDLEQREGRIIRRGNELYMRDPDGFRIVVNRYATAQTYDTRRWQLLEHKAAGLEQLRNYSGVSEMDDVANEASNSADMKAAASGNPLILKETQLANEVKKLHLLERAHRDGDFLKRSSINSNRVFVESFGPTALSGWETVKTQRDSNGVLGIYAGKRLVDKDAVMEAIDDINAHVTTMSSSRTLVYRGLKFDFSRDEGRQLYRMDMPAGDMKLMEAISRSGIVTRMDNWCESVEGEISFITKRMENSAASIVEMEKLIGKPFEQAGDLLLAIGEHGKVQRALMKSNSIAAVKPAEAQLFKLAVDSQKAKLRAMGFGEAVAEIERSDVVEVVAGVDDVAAVDSKLLAGAPSAQLPPAAPGLLDGDLKGASASLSSVASVASVAPVRDAAPIAGVVPQAVRSQVLWALAVLRDVESALVGVQRARGDGHFLSLEVKDQAGKLVRPNEILDDFRKHAKGNGVDAEALILELGGVADLARFSKSLEVSKPSSVASVVAPVDAALVAAGKLLSRLTGGRNDIYALAGRDSVDQRVKLMSMLLGKDRVNQAEAGVTAIRAEFYKRTGIATNLTPRASEIAFGKWAELNTAPAVAEVVGVVADAGFLIGGLSGPQIEAMQGGKMTGAWQFPGVSPSLDQVEGRRQVVLDARAKEQSALELACGADKRIAVLHEAGVPVSQVLQAFKELTHGDDSLVNDLARIVGVELPVALSLGVLGMPLDKVAVDVAALGLDVIKTRMVEALVVERERPVPAGWIVMNAPRPLLGSVTMQGDFVTGRFYAAIDPDDSMAKSFICENVKLDARIVVVVDRDTQMELALHGNKYRDQYMELDAESRFEHLSSQIENFRNLPFGELSKAILEAKGVVKEGSFSGQVLSVANGVVVQRVSRDGKTVCHDMSKLSAQFAVGDVVDVQYRGGQGVVKGAGVAQGVVR